MKTSSQWLSISGSSLLTAIILTIGLSLSAQTVTDIDGNVYNTVTIGTQTWMVENLKTTRYRNGDLIGTTVPATLDISGETNPKYQWAYEGNETFVPLFGRLYTWYAATDSRNICPAGWHLPTDAEWTILTNYLGGDSIAGGKLKESGTLHWLSPNTGATNETGFSALPGGIRNISGGFQYGGGYGGWWSSTDFPPSSAWFRYVVYDNKTVTRDNYCLQYNGFSVRCIKDSTVPGLTIKPASNPVLSDGIINASDPWIETDWVDISLPNINNSTSAMSAKFQLKYDDMNLYFAATVNDASRWTGNSTTYLNDCIEFFIAMDTTSGALGTYKTGDSQFRFQAVSDPLAAGGLIEWHQVELSTGVFTCVDNGTDYVQEWTLPWAELSAGMDPAWDKKQFKFDIQVADATSNGLRTQQMFWNNNSDLQWNNTTVLGVVTLETPIQDMFSGGSGTQADPYLVATAANLNNVRHFLGIENSDVYFLQTADIDLGVAPWNEGEGWAPIGNETTQFFGNYNGNGFTISGLTINRPETNYVGLFGWARESNLSNIALVDVNIIGKARVGALAGQLRDNSWAINCYSTGSVKAQVFASGLVGNLYYGSTISICYSSVNVEMVYSPDGNQQAGGLVGRASYNSNIYNSFATGRVQGLTSFNGGLVALVTDGSIVENCYATGETSGERSVGGLIGALQLSTINNCYSVGKVNFSVYGGGFLGYLYPEGATISNCYWNIETSRQEASATGEGKNTLQMTNSATFSSWDFLTFWKISEGITYPYQEFQISPGSYNYPIPFIQPTKLTAANGDGSISLSWQAPSMGSVVEYNIYRDSIKIGTSLANSYIDNGLANFITHKYALTAIYSTGESDFSNSVSAFGTSGFNEGDGSIANPFLISNAGELYTVRVYLSSNFKQVADIDLGLAPWNTGEGWEPIGGNFTGTYDGNGYTISNLTINRLSKDGVGLFRMIQGSSVTDLLLDNVSINGNDNVGALAGWAGESNLKNISINGSISGNNFVGGLVGSTFTLNLNNCKSSGTINATGYNIGGLTGDHFEQSITINSFSTMSITSTGDLVGGLFGSNEIASTVANSYFLGSVSGNQNVGGITGWVSNSSINSCFSTGSVTGNSLVGGLAGELAENGSVTKSYWNTQTSGQTTSAGGEGRTTDNMTYAYDAETYKDWDFTYIWAKDIASSVNNGYPYLRLLNVDMPSIILTTIGNITDNGVDFTINISSDGGVPVTERGICWGYNTNPSIFDSHIIQGAGAGTFPINIGELDAQTMYYARAYATNSVGTSYGPEVTFTTLASPNNNMNNDPVTTCYGYFFDSGGEFGNYTDSEDFTKVFYPSTPGSKMSFSFNSFTTEGGYDLLYIFDGPDSSSPQFPGSPFSGSQSPGTIVASSGNPSGAITFQFISDGSYNQFGWSATINCKAEVILITEPNYGNPPDWDWIQLVGGSGEDVSRDVEIDPSGNVYVTGFFVDSMKIGTTMLRASGLKDMYIAKYNSAGSLQWVKTATTGNPYNEIVGVSVEYTPYGIYVTGNFKGNQFNFGTGNVSFTDDPYLFNSFVARYSTNGTLNWVKYDEINTYAKIEYLSSSDRIYAVTNNNWVFIRDKDWNPLSYFEVGYSIADIGVTGNYLYLACNDNVSARMKIYQYDLAGNMNWELTDESSNAESQSWPNDLSVDPDGNVYVTGGFYSQFNLQGYGFPNDGNNNGLVIKVDPSGTVKWITRVNPDNSITDNLLKTTFSGGKLYVCGNSTGETTLGAATIPANTNFIAVLGSSGNIISGYDYNFPVNELISDINYLYSCGNNRIRLVDKFSFSGASSWQGTSKAYTGNSVIWYQSDVDESGNILLHGWIEGITNIGNTSIDAGNDNLYVAKLDIAGNLKWIKTGRQNGSGQTSGISHDQMGNVIAWGTFSDTLEFEGIKVYEPVSGAYIVKYDPDGKLMWVNYFTGSYIIGTGGIDTDESGNIIIGGTYSGSVVFKNNTYLSLGSNDFFVAKYDADGMLLWSRSYGSTGNDWCRSVSIDKNDNILIAGRYGQPIQIGNYSLPRTGGSDLFIAKLPPDGNDQNIIAVKAGGTSSESANSVVTADNGDVYISGYIYSLETIFQDTTVYLDPDLGGALFVAKYSPDLNLDWVSIMSSDYVWPLYKMDVDKEGNCYMGGQVGTQLLLPGDVSISSNGSRGMFVSRYDKSGELNWLKSIRAEGGFTGLFAVSALDVDNIVLGGRLTNDIGTFDDQTLFSTNDNGFLATIRSEETLKVYVEKTDVSLPGAKDGKINLTVSGGTAPYTFSWNTGATAEDLSLLNPGTYTVTINDAAGFTVVKTIRIYEAPVYLCEARFNFAWDTTAIFTDLSIGDPKAWYWDFGDGISSTLKNPEHTYSKEGSYNVSLTIFNSLTNCISTVTNTIFAGSVECQADFSFVVNAVSGIAAFTSTSLNATDYFWDFGNGTYSTQVNPEYTYLKAGMFSVCLTIQNSGSGCQSVICKNLTYIPEGEKYITADFSFFSGTTDNMVTFNDLSSSNTTDWYWTMGDGKVVSTENPVYTYSNPGVYSVCLTAIDKVNLLMNTVCKEVKVGEIACNIGADFSYFINPEEQSVAFSNKSVGSVTNYFWTFGDGGSSSLENPSYTYSSPGFYLITLSVRNSSNKCMDMTAQFIQVGGVDCRAGFTFGVDPLTNTVSFMDDSKGDIDYYYWEFGDGSFSTLQNPAKLYKKAGVYLVGQTVIDNTNECIDVFYQPVQAGEVECIAEFVSYVDAVTSTAYFTNRVVGESTALLWSFGDGRFSTNENPIHQFPGEGLYTAGLNTYDLVSECMDYYQEDLLIGGLGIDCEADFVYMVDPSTPDVIFSNKSIGDIVESLWNFGDGSENSTDKDASHTYTKGGYYNVCLSVINSSGIKNMSCKWVLVAGSAANDCRANFMFSIDSSTRKVTFVDNSFGEIDKYTWDFGDSREDSVSNVTNPTHTYDVKGYYLVQLKAENTVSGCVSNEYKLLNVAELQVLKAAFGYEARDPDKKVSGYPVDLVSASSGDGATVEWDFGDKQIKKETFTVMDSTSGIVTHYYEKPGKYRVCLRISDKVSGQTDEYCQFVFTKFGIGVEQITGNESNLAVYPNPFMDYTTISYSVPEHQFVEMAVFDQMGRRMETLVKTKKDAGEYEIVWESKGIAPGIYHLKLITEEGIFTRQLVVAK